LTTKRTNTATLPKRFHTKSDPFQTSFVEYVTARKLARVANKWAETDRTVFAIFANNRKKRNKVIRRDRRGGWDRRAVVNRFGDLTNKGKYSQTALVAYIKEQFGVDASGSMDELRRLAMLGPSM
jgi:hypothetical protein